MDNDLQVKNGDRYRVVAGRHKGKLGAVADVHISKGGNVTITVIQDNGERFKTLARNVVIEGKSF